MFLYLFLTIFPCSIVQIKLIGFAFEEEGEYRQVKECAVNGILLIRPGNTGERERFGKLGKHHSLYYWVIEFEGRWALYEKCNKSWTLGFGFRKEIRSKEPTNGSRQRIRRKCWRQRRESQEERIINRVKGEKMKQRSYWIGGYVVFNDLQDQPHWHENQITVDWAVSEEWM